MQAAHQVHVHKSVQNIDEQGSGIKKQDDRVTLAQSKEIMLKLNKPIDLTSKHGEKQ